MEFMGYKAETVVPYEGDEAGKSGQVKRMFNEIAGQYDALNHTLALGIDRYWRKRAIRLLKKLRPGTLLDIATGTGDLALEAYRQLHPRSITGIDISEKMVEIARQKVLRTEVADKITFRLQDCTVLSFTDNTFDAATVAFGMRNFENLDKSLQEVHRVLRPGGKFVVLELSVPEHFPVRQAYLLYSRIVIPMIGKWKSGNREAYNYLPRSIRAFPQNAELADILRKNGFSDVTFRKLTLGVCTLYTGTKADS